MVTHLVGMNSISPEQGGTLPEQIEIIYKTNIMSSTSCLDCPDAPFHKQQLDSSESFILSSLESLWISLFRSAIFLAFLTNVSSSMDRGVALFMSSSAAVVRVNLAKWSWKRGVPVYILNIQEGSQKTKKPEKTRSPSLDHEILTKTSKKFFFFLIECLLLLQLPCQHQIVFITSVMYCS